MRENYALAQAVLMSGDGLVETAVQAIKLGAYHFVQKGCSGEELLSVLRNAGDHQDLDRQVLALSAQVAESDREFVVGPSRAMRDVVDLVQRVAGLSADGPRPRRKRHGQGAGGAADPPGERTADAVRSSR